MKRKGLALFIVLIILSCIPLYAFAAIPREELIVDFADLLTTQELIELESLAQKLRDTYETDVIIVTQDGLGGKTPQSYADDFFDEEGYGYGATGSGVLFLLDMEQRNWYISTSGDAIYALTDYGIQKLGEAAVPYLSQGLYYDAFCVYLTELDVYLSAYQQGQPVDGYADYSGDYYRGDRDEILYYEESHRPNLLLSLTIGVLVAGIAVLIMRASMNAKRLQRGASGYMKAGSFHLQMHRDLFLYSNVSKVRRQQNNTSSSGGSSIHRSSGGRSHGGGGGRF